MGGDTGAKARHELLTSMREMLKAIRIMKSDTPPRRMAVPGGTFGVLAVIDQISPATGCHVKDLAERCALDPSTISRAVGTLVKQGLVARTADPSDGRASVLILTASGKHTLDDVTGWYDEKLAAALKDWSEADLYAFTAMLQRFCDDLMTRNNTLEAAR